MQLFSSVESSASFAHFAHTDISAGLPVHGQPIPEEASLQATIVAGPQQTQRAHASAFDQLGPLLISLL